METWVVAYRIVLEVTHSWNMVFQTGIIPCCHVLTL